MSCPDSKGDEPKVKPYRVYVRYLVIVDVEAASEEAAIDEARAVEMQEGEWETVDCQVEPLGEGEDA